MAEIGQPPDAFPHAFEAAFACLRVQLEEACAGGSDWPAAVAAAITAVLEWAAVHSAAADVLTNGAMAAGRDGIARRRRLLDYIGRGLAPGRRRPRGGELPEVTEHALAGGLVALVGERVAAGRVDELPSLAPEAIQFVLTPYLGAEEASRIAARA